jgi:hypothetical protein
VARTKSTTRPITSEELAVAGPSLNKEEVHNSGNRGDEEIRSEDKSGAEEDLADVEAGPNDLVAEMRIRS